VVFADRSQRLAPTGASLRDPCRVLFSVLGFVAGSIRQGPAQVKRMALGNTEHMFYHCPMDAPSQPVRSALQRVDGMPFHWSLNPYRGCRHACTYCYARIYHSYLGFADPGDFDRVILHKPDLPSILARELRQRRAPLGSEVAIGTATDPYQPLEAKQHLTRRCLDVLLQAGEAVSITTKSPLITRDLDLLRAFAAYGGVRVQITVTVLDPDLLSLLEPHAPSPRGRLRAMAALTAAGIPTSLFLAPIVPGLGAGDASAVLDAAAAAGAHAAMLLALRLSPGVRAWLLPRIAARRPDAAADLARLYAGRDTLPRPERERLMAPIAARRRSLGLDRPPAALRARRDQLALFGPPDANRPRGTAARPDAD